MHENPTIQADTVHLVVEEVIMSRFHGLDKGLLVALKTEILEKLMACEIHISALGNENLSQDDVLDMATVLDLNLANPPESLIAHAFVKFFYRIKTKVECEMCSITFWMQADLIQDCSKLDQFVSKFTNIEAEQVLMREKITEVNEKLTALDNALVGITAVLNHSHDTTDKALEQGSFAQGSGSMDQSQSNDKRRSLSNDEGGNARKSSRQISPPSRYSW